MRQLMLSHWSHTLQNEVSELFSCETQNWKRKYRYRKFRFSFLPATRHVYYLLNRLNSGLIWLNNQLTVLIWNLSSHLIASWWNSSFWQINVSYMRKFWKHYLLSRYQQITPQFSQPYCWVGILTLISYLNCNNKKLHKQSTCIM